MSRIIYGYSGEGSGHASRTREMAGYLLSQGHQLRLVSYDRGYQSLQHDFPVTEIEGLTIASTDNRVSVFHTIRENLKRLPAGTNSWRRLRTLFQEFQPDAVISDFEPLTAYLAEHFDVPLISLDNQHRLRYLKYQPPPGRESQAAFTRHVIQAMVPWPSVSLITSLIPDETTNDRSFVFPPIVRQEIRHQKPSCQDHVLVYLTSGFNSLIPMLKQFAAETFFVYGYERQESEDNLCYFRRSKQQFAEHLASCQAVIATAGFTLISEALFLGKPYLALPMEGQFEQELNAWQLQASRFGMRSESLSSDRLGHFLYRGEEFRRRLMDYPRDDGLAIKNKLSELVEDGAGLARTFKQRR